MVLAVTAYDNRYGLREPALGFTGPRKRHRSVGLQNWLPYIVGYDPYNKITTVYLLLELKKKPARYYSLYLLECETMHVYIVRLNK